MTQKTIEQRIVDHIKSSALDGLVNDEELEKIAKQAISQSYKLSETKSRPTPSG